MKNLRVSLFLIFLMRGTPRHNVSPTALNQDDDDEDNPLDVSRTRERQLSTVSASLSFAFEIETDWPICHVFDKIGCTYDCSHAVFDHV